MSAFAHLDQLALVTALMAVAGLLYDAGRKAEQLSRARRDINAIFAAIRKVEAKVDRVVERLIDGEAR